MAVLIIGGTGTVGSALAEALGKQQAITTSRLPMDGHVLFDPVRDSIARIVHETQPVTHVVLAYGIAGVGRCAVDPDGTAQVNVRSVLRLADEARSMGLCPVFLSSDYVFDGTKGGWRETDRTSPVNEYGRQKLAVEREIGEGTLVVRLSRVIGDLLRRRCVLFDWVRASGESQKIRCATDQWFSPIAAADAGRILATLIRSDARGLVHLAGPEATSRFALYGRLLRLAGSLGLAELPPAQPCLLSDIPSPEPHPLDTTLSIELLEQLVRPDFSPLDTTIRQVLQAPAAGSSSASVD